MATTFPGTMLDITVELFNIMGDSTWTDVSQYVFYQEKIKIHRGLGAQDTGKDGAPESCYITFKNLDKRFSPRNRFGPYFGYLGQNTPIRVKWNAGNGDKTRFEGFVPNWNPKIPTNDARNVPIVAYDWRQQLETGSGRKQANSPIYLSTIGQGDTLVTYAPFEDMENTLSPSVINGSSVAVQGVINYANDNGVPGSKALASFTANSYIIIGSEIGHVYDGHWQFDFFYKLSNLPSVAYTLIRVTAIDTGTSTIAYWDVIMDVGSYRVRGFNRFGTVIVDSGPFANSGWLLGDWMHHRLMVANQTSTTFKYNFVSFPINPSLGGFSIGEVTGVTGQCGKATLFSILPNAERDGDAGGHFAFYDAYNLSAVDNSADAYNNEPPGTRFSRLLGEYEIPVTRRTPAWADTVAMGRQSKESDLISNLRECAVSNEGFIDATVGSSDSEAGGRLRLTERGYIEERTVALTLNYASGVLYALDANDDDFATVNDFTARRSEGASARVVQTRGNKNINLRKDDRLGVGPYAAGLDFSLSTDVQALDHAGWAVNQGTVDEMRVINCELWFERKDTISANVLATYENLDTWSWIRVTNLPTDYGGSGEQFNFFMQGRDEEFDQKTLHVNFYGPPVSPWKVGILDTSGGASSNQRIDLDASRTMGPMTNIQTTVTTWDESSNLVASKWAHDDGDWVATIDGEDVTVSAVADVTPSFVGAGTASAADNNTTNPTIHASSAKDDLMVGVVYCRNQAAQVFFSSDWEQIDTAGYTNFKVYQRVHSGSEAPPNVIIAGGSAGDTVISQIYTFRGIAPNALACAFQTNGSAANIAVPAVQARRVNSLFLAIGGKADDWTSVATLAGYTGEAGDTFSTLGNDAGLVVDYLLASGTVIETSTAIFTVTGGGAAVSQAIAIAIDGNVQTLTIARGVNLNNVGIAHPANQEVHVVDTNSIILGI